MLDLLFHFYKSASRKQERPCYATQAKENFLAQHCLHNKPLQNYVQHLNLTSVFTSLPRIECYKRSRLPPGLVCLNLAWSRSAVQKIQKLSESPANAQCTVHTCHVTWLPNYVLLTVNTEKSFLALNSHNQFNQLPQWGTQNAQHQHIKWGSSALHHSVLFVF